MLKNVLAGSVAPGMPEQRQTHVLCGTQELRWTPLTMQPVFVGLWETARDGVVDAYLFVSKETQAYAMRSCGTLQPVEPGFGTLAHVEQTLAEPQTPQTAEPGILKHVTDGLSLLLTAKPVILNMLELFNQLVLRSLQFFRQLLQKLFR